MTTLEVTVKGVFREPPDFCGKDALCLFWLDTLWPCDTDDWLECNLSCRKVSVWLGRFFQMVAHCGLGYACLVPEVVFLGFRSHPRLSSVSSILVEGDRGRFGLWCLSEAVLLSAGCGVLVRFFLSCLVGPGCLGNESQGSIPDVRIHLIFIRIGCDICPFAVFPVFCTVYSIGTAYVQS